MYVPSEDATLQSTLPIGLSSPPVMGISVEQRRAAIGSYSTDKSCILAHSSRVPVLFSNFFSLLCFVATTSLQLMMKALMLLILLSGDVERNPGPDIMGEPVPKPHIGTATDITLCISALSYCRLLEYLY